MPAAGWQRYVGPAAFLLLATVAVLLIRSGLEHGHDGSGAATPTAPASPQRHAASTTTAATTTAKKPGHRFWTVQAGDTFGVIARKSGVPVATIEQLNPNVKSTSLFIGEKIRIR
jgi:LysM repeat protein